MHAKSSLSRDSQPIRLSRTWPEIGAQGRPEGAMNPCTAEDAYRMKVTPSPSIGWFGRRGTRRCERQAESEATRKGTETTADVAGRIGLSGLAAGLALLGEERSPQEFMHRYLRRRALPNPNHRAGLLPQLRRAAGNQVPMH